MPANSTLMKLFTYMPCISENAVLKITAVMLHMNASFFWQFIYHLELAYILLPKFITAQN